VDDMIFFDVTEVRGIVEVRMALSHAIFYLD
jgi:hypothetical protein